MSATYFRVRNWDNFQHYKNRNPPWIKLHFALLASEDWVMFDDASRVLAIACMLIASRNEGRVPNKPDYVRRVAYLNTSPDFGPLVECGFLEEEKEDASTMLADASVSVSVSKNIDTTPTVQKEASTREADADISYALDIFNEAAAEAGWPRAEKLTDKRRTGFRRTLAEYGIEGWRKGLAKARGSPFLRGDNDRGWRADLDFFLRPQTFTKLMEGSYEPSTSFQPLRSSGQSISESFASAVARRHGRGQRPADADDRFRTDEDGAEGHQEASRTIEGEVVAFPERH